MGGPQAYAKLYAEAHLRGETKEFRPSSGTRYKGAMTGAKKSGNPKTPPQAHSLPQWKNSHTTSQATFPSLNPHERTQTPPHGCRTNTGAVFFSQAKPAFPPSTQTPRLRSGRWSAPKPGMRNSSLFISVTQMTLCRLMPRSVRFTARPGTIVSRLLPRISTR